MPGTYLVDSHCHLDFPEYADQLDAVVARAAAAGVEVCLSIGTELKRFAGVKAVAEKFPNVWCSVGVHPHESEKELLDDEAALVREAAHPKVVGIGETGLPVIVHTRDADDDTIAILRDEMGKGAFGGLIHCFTGTQKLADAALEMGLSLSVSGIATFKNSTALRDVIKSVPLERLLVETDAPFLAPVPYRGKTNEPAFVVHTARMLAELKGVTVEELAKVTTEHFFRLFSKVQRPA